MTAPDTDLRDKLAMSATEEDIDRIIRANTHERFVQFMGTRTWCDVTREQARYIHADAMLEARKEKSHDPNPA